MFFIIITKENFLHHLYDSEMGKMFSLHTAYNIFYFHCKFLSLNENEQRKEVRKGTLFLKEGVGRVYLNVYLI